MNWVDRYRALRPSVRNFIDGRWWEIEGGLLDKRCPRDGELLVRFGAGGLRDTESAVRSARSAFEDGRWSSIPIQRRRDVLHRLACLIEKHSEELALLECLDAGKPISVALTFDIPTAVARLKYYAEAWDKCHGKVYAVNRSSLSYQLRRPIGVVAGIIGWNFPLLLSVGKIGPALITGNSLILKPSELTSLSASWLAELALEAGLPEGVFNVVHGNSSVGALLAAHSDVDLVTFTGSTRTGKSLLVASGQSNMKRLILECGGKAPNIVFEDCSDLEEVAEGIVGRAFWNQGQVCTASSRLLVQEVLKERLLSVVVAKAAKLVPQDPLDPASQYGALVSHEHKKKVMGYVDTGLRQGARLAYRSEAAPPHEQGFYLGPVILDDVAQGHTVAQEEIFGPVLSVMTFRDEEEAVQLANSTIYGLSAILWTTNIGRAHRVSQRLRAGWITVNGTGRPSGGAGAGVLSIGGHKESGIGTEGGLEGLEAYTISSAVQMFV